MNDKKDLAAAISADLLDRLADIAKEYSIDSEILVAAAVEKLLDDIDFFRDLRAGKFS